MTHITLKKSWTQLALLITILPLLLLAACSSTPQPDWKANTKDGLDRASAAYLKGDTRTATQEFAYARAEVARTGRADMLARVVLTECALHVASLDLNECKDFQALQQDASDTERAYANYLSGQIPTQEIALLPSQHRAIAAAQTDVATTAALKDISDPIAKLVAAGVLLRTHRASPSILNMAVETASSQGWRRPLLAWLGTQQQLAQQGGDTELAQKLQRHMEWIQNQGQLATPSSSTSPAADSPAAPPVNK